MKLLKQLLIEKKADLLEEYMNAVDANNGTRATYLRGKLNLISEILKEMIE